MAINNADIRVRMKQTEKEAVLDLARSQQITISEWVRLQIKAASEQPAQQAA